MKHTLIKSIIWGLLLLFVTLLSIWPLFDRGFIPTHDGEYHIVRFMEFWRMFTRGYLFPRWAAGLNSGYGVPLFNFFYPLPNYLGIFYHALGWSFVDAFKLTLATGYVLAGIFCFFWLRKLFSLSAALVGTILFLRVPYWFVDIYVRGSIGEVLAICFLILTLASIEHRKKTLLALGVGGLILSHNILALLFLPFIFIYLLWRAPRYYLMFFILGIGLATYFWLPAIAERRHVIGLNTVNFRQHFPGFDELLIPSWGTGFSGQNSFNKMSFQIGIVPLLLIFLFYIFCLEKIKPDFKKLTLFFAALPPVLFFLMLPQSQLIWDLIVVLPYLQYPWRLLSFWLPLTAFFGAYLLDKFKIDWLAISLILVSLGLTDAYTHPVIYARRQDAYYLTRSEFTDGTSSLSNSFSTKWSAWKENRPEKRIEVNEPDSQIISQLNRDLEYQFAVISPTDTTVRVNLLYYPGWQVTVNGKKQAIDYEKDGTIAFSVLAGTSQVKVKFIETILRKVADAISLICLFWLVSSVILEKQYGNRH